MSATLEMVRACGMISGMVDRLTVRARKAVAFAHEEALGLEHSFVGPEHLLLGLLREGEQRAAAGLGLLEMTAADVRERVRCMARSQRPVRGGISFSPQAKRALVRSLREAVSRGSDRADVEHVLLALLDEQNGAAARVVVSLGADLEALRAALVVALGRRQATWVFFRDKEPASRLALFFITPDELAGSLARLSADLGLVTLGKRWDVEARTSRVFAEWPPGTPPDASPGRRGVLLFVPENANLEATKQPDDLSRPGPIIHLPLLGPGALVGPRVLVACGLQLDNATPATRMLFDQLQRGLDSDLTAPTWIWELERPKQAAVPSRGLRHSAGASKLYSEGWAWRQFGVEGLGYGPCSPG